MILVDKNQCMEGDPQNKTIVKLQNCDSSNQHQRWTWGFLNETLFIK